VLKHIGRVVLVAVIVWCGPGTSARSLENADLPYSVNTEDTLHKGFPKRSITIIAPASPGGGWDQLARVMQHSLIVNDIAPVNIEVVNRGGAGGTIGLTELITQHRRDPHTWMVGGSTLISAMLMHDSRFNLAEAELLARLASEFNVVAVPTDSPFNSMEELMAAFIANPDTFVWGGGSAGSADHLMIGMIARDAGIDPQTINYVAYPGGGEAAAAIMGQQIQAGVAGYAEWKDLAEAGKMRLLAISSPERLAGARIPTLKESGLDVELENWRFVIAGPGVLPDERIRILEMLTEMRDSEEWKKVLKTYSWEDRFLTGPELETYIASEMRSTALLLEDLGMTGSGRPSATGPYLFPKIVLLLLVFTGGALFLQAFMGRRASASTGSMPAKQVSEVEWRGFLLSGALIVGYIASLGMVGFLIATPIYLICQAYLMGSRSLIRDGAIFIIFTIAVFLIFEQLLSIRLP
jgi:putative tricarboxylic transport membrane protein